MYINIYLKYPLYNAECVYVCLCLIVQYWKGIQQQKILRTLTFYGQLYLKKENNEKISLMNKLKCNLKLQIKYVNSGQSKTHKYNAQ